MTLGEHPTKRKDLYIMTRNYDNYKNAFNGTSFSPETRFNSWVSDHKRTMLEAEAYGKEIGVDQEYLEKYLDRLDRAFCDYLTSHSNCISSMITGPANFPVHRAQKLSGYADKKLEKYCYYANYKDRLKKRLSKKTQDEKSQEWTDRIKELEAKQEFMKQVNKLIRKNDDQGLRDLGLSDGRIAQLKTPDFCGRIGYADYELKNNYQNIKRLKAQVQENEIVKKVCNSFEVGEIKIEHDDSDLRWNIYFPDKPDVEVRTKLKRNGFKWSPTRMAWTRGSKTMSKPMIESILTA